MNDKEKIFQQIREAIITNQIRQGERLNEKKLMADYGVGRTPLREIFFQLREEGLIEIIPKVGTTVTPVEVQEIRDVIEVRRWMEKLVGKLATERIVDEQLSELREIIQAVDELAGEERVDMDTLNRYDARFHQILYQASGNAVLMEMLPGLMSKMVRFWYYIGFQVTEYFDHFNDLRALLNALEAGDTAGVQHALEIHLNHFVEKVKHQIL